MATLGNNDAGEPRARFGKLAANEFYRVSGLIKGNQGEIKSVRVAGVAEYWPADLFVPVPPDQLEALAAKVKELDRLGEGQVVAKGVRRAMEGLV